MYNPHCLNVYRIIVGHGFFMCYESKDHPHPYLLGGVRLELTKEATEGCFLECNRMRSRVSEGGHGNGMKWRLSVRTSHGAYFSHLAELHHINVPSALHRLTTCNYYTSLPLLPHYIVLRPLLHYTAWPPLPNYAASLSLPHYTDSLLLLHYQLSPTKFILPPILNNPTETH